MPHLPITLEAAKASRMNMSRSSKTRDSRMLVAAPRLVYPATVSRCYKFLTVLSFGRYCTGTANIFIRAKNILNISCTEEPCLRFTCDGFAISFYFSSFWIIDFFFLQSINHSTLSMERNSKHVHTPASHSVKSTGFKYLLGHNVPIIINIS